MIGHSQSKVASCQPKWLHVLLLAPNNAKWSVAVPNAYKCFEGPNILVNRNGHIHNSGPMLVIVVLYVCNGSKW